MIRPPIIRASYLLPDEIVADSFAGGGGTSTGIEAALGRPVDIAINHSPAAIAMHAANHPETRHYCENVWEVAPRDACGSRPVGLAWFSPDCTHFSRAKGAAPREQGRRGLAWVVIRWAHDVRPRIIVLENVEEFQTWGPLDADGQPDPKRSGSTFREWLGKLKALGYEVQWRSLVAADYGAPTTRRRLFLVARCDGLPIVWPERTHGVGAPLSWRTAAEIIDWGLPCPSIFERRRPLAEATLRRIAEGLRRYVIECDAPFIAPSGCVPTLIQTGYGERPGQTPRVPGLEKPLGTVVAGGAKHALVAAFLSRHYGGPHGGAVGRTMTQPVATVTAKDHHSLTTAFLTKFYGTSTGAPVTVPLPTVTSGGGRGGGHLAEVRAFLVKFYKSGEQWQGAGEPLHTVTTKARFGLVTVQGQEYAITDIGMRMLSPRELFAAQGFPSDYEIAPHFEGAPMGSTMQIALAGNSVSPPVAAAIVAANTNAAQREAA